jgi:porphobilinogen synthase
MVKPTLPYLDILASASELAPDHPLACYQVSGEFAMIVAGANAGVYDLKTMAFESAQCMLRAGLSCFIPAAVVVIDSIPLV